MTQLRINMSKGTHILSTDTDPSTGVTEDQLAARERAQKAEAKYRAIFENATEGIFQTTPDGRYLSANPALAKMFGYESAAEMIGNIHDIAWQTYVAPERRNELKKLLESQPSVQGFEVERFRRDGRRFWISVNGHAVRDATGKVLYYEGTSQDITPRKLAESVLRHSENKFRSFFEFASSIERPGERVVRGGSVPQFDSPTSLITDASQAPS